MKQQNEGEENLLDMLRDMGDIPVPQMKAPDMNRADMYTCWGETLDKEKVLQEYPRPQMERSSYINLNGFWECSFTEGEQPQTWEKILVPFSPETPLSGVKRILHPQETLWYRRSLPDIGEGTGRLLLHFGAVDQEARVYVNGKLVTQHQGGYTPFSADITEALQSGQNELLVEVKDDTDASWHSRGKQQQLCGMVWYTPQSGIWQTVWMERVPEKYIEGLWITPKYDEKKLELTVYTSAPDMECRAHIGEMQYSFLANQPYEIPVEGFAEWTPEHPCLHDFTVESGEDRVKSYFALRKTEVRGDEAGVKRLFLNNRPYFHTGMLDQGYYPDGLYTAPSDEAIIYDIQSAKDMGFNMLRKHIKVEPLRWYYHCDRLGMLVWQDMVNGGRTYKPEAIYLPTCTGVHQKDDQYELFGRQDAQGRAEYYRELDEMVRLLYNSPCVVMWVPFNEGWGQFDAAEAVRRIEAVDRTRTIDHASGWNDQGIGLFKSQHVYGKEYRLEEDALGRAVILTEYGGYVWKEPEHSFAGEPFGYLRYDTPEALAGALEALFAGQLLPAKKQGLAAAVYTQLADVEMEMNGLLTYDRKSRKVPAEKIAALNALLRDNV